MSNENPLRFTVIASDGGKFVSEGFATRELAKARADQLAKEGWPKVEIVDSQAR